MLRHQEDDRPVHVEELPFVGCYQLREFRLLEHLLRSLDAFTPDLRNAVVKRPVAGEKAKPVGLRVRLDIFDDVTPDVGYRHHQRAVHALPIIIERNAAYAGLAHQQFGNFDHRLAKLAFAA
jgi:hypothetical protein